MEREKPGTGLGLYLARNLVRQLRGRIRVRDPLQGSGAVFEVQLPGAMAALPAAEDELAAEREHPAAPPDAEPLVPQE